MPVLHVKTFPHDIPKSERKELGRAFVQQTLQAALGVREPLVMARTAQGKPYLPDYPGLFFNYSDSGEMIVLAIGGSPVGVDIEMIRPREFQGVLERFFLPEEVQEINRAKDEEERLALFFRLWTAKESLLKYIGCGLGGEMNRHLVCGTEARYQGKKLYLRTYLYKDGKLAPFAAAAARRGEIVLTLCSENQDEVSLFVS